MLGLYILSYLEIRTVLVRSGRFTTRMVTNEKQKKLNIPITRCYPKTDKSWIDYRALTKYGLSASIDELCNHFFRLFKMDGNDSKTYFWIYKSFAFVTTEQRGKTCLPRYVTCVESENKYVRYSYLILIINRYFIKIYLCLIE